MISMALSLVRNHKAGLAGVFVAVLFGSAVLTACGILVDSGVRGGFPPERYAAASVVVGAPQSLSVANGESQPYLERVPVPAGWAREIERVPGVKTAVPDVSVPVGIATQPGKSGSGKLLAGTSGKPIIAHGWSSTALGPFTVSTGSAPRGPGEVALDTALAAQAGVRPGDTIEVLFGAVPGRYRVTALVAPPPGGLARQSAVFLADGTPPLLASGRSGQADTIGVIADPGVSDGALASRISAAVPGAVTYTGVNRAAAEFLDIGQGRSFLVQVASSLGGTIAGVVLFVVAAALGVAIGQRRREMALLRAIAATPRQVRQLIGAEVLLVSTVAAMLGTLPGLAVSFLMRDAFVSAGMIPAGFSFVLDPLPFVASVAVCVLMARGAALLAARRVSRLGAVGAIAEAADKPVRAGRLRLAIGYLLLLAGVGTAIAAPLFAAGQTDAIQSSVSGAALVLLVAVALLGPRWLPLVVRLVLGRQRRQHSAGAGTFLADASLHARSRRVSLAVIPLVMAVALAVVEIFGTTTLVAASQRQAREGLTADYVVTGAGQGLSPRVADVIRAVPGVSAVTQVARTEVVASYTFGGDKQAESFSAQGVSPAALDATMNLDVTSGSMAALSTPGRDGTVALSQSAAGTLGASVGRTVGLRLGDGTPLTPRVVAVYRDGLGYGDITLPNATVIDHTTSRLDADILVRTASGAGSNAGEVKRALDAALAPYPVTVSGRGTFTAAQAAELANESKASLVLNAILLAYVIIAMVNSLVMATAARAREFALLRLLGATGRHVRGMMRREAAVIAVAAVVIGSLAALPPLVSVSLGLAGSPVPAIPPLDYLGIVIAAAAVGWGSIMIPARLAMRARPAEALDGRT